MMVSMTREKSTTRLREYALLLNEQIERLNPAPTPCVRRDHFEVFSEFLPCMIWTAAADGMMLYFNQRLRELTGYTGLDYTQLLHADDAARVIAEWEDSVRHRTVYCGHTRLRTRHGDYRYIVARAAPILSPGGDVDFWIGSATALPEPAIKALLCA